MTPSAETPRAALRSRIGGRWAVSRVGWLVSLPFALLGTTLAHAGQISSVRALALWLMAGVLGWLALGAGLLAAHLTVLRRRHQRPAALTLVVAVGAVVGAIRSLAVGVAADSLGLINPTDGPTRALGGAVLGSVWIPLLAATLDAHDRYRQARDQLITAQLAERVQALGTAEQTEALRRELLQGIDENLSEATADLRARIERLRHSASSTHDELESLAIDLSHAATDAVRPLSQQLWSAEDSRIPGLRPREILRTTLSAASLKPASAAGIGFLAGITGITANEGISVALQSVIPASGLMLLWLASVEGMRRRLKHLAAPLYAVGTLGAGVVALVLIPLLQSAGVGRGASIGWAAAGTLIFVPTVIMLGISEVVAQERLSVLERLQEQLHGTRLHRIAADEQATAVRRELSEFLHGTVQSQLMAASLAVANAQRTGDRSLLERGLDSAAAALNVRQAQTTMDPSDLLGGIKAVAESWQGLVDVELQVPASSEMAALTPTVAQLAASVVREALANAVRHGHARHVLVRIADGDGALTVTIENDGDTPGSTRPGLGSTLLDRVAPGGWSLEPREGGGARLTVHLPIPTQ